MGTCGFSPLRRGQRARSVSPGMTLGRMRRLAALAPSPRRVAASAACLLILALAVAGCAALTAALQTDAALSGAGYQDVNVNVATGSGVPDGGLISVSYSHGPTGNDQRDAQGAEKIVWNTFPGRFGALDIVKRSGGCAGPFCATKSNEVASATYAQLAASFGPRPPGLDTAPAPGRITVPGWVIGVGVGLAVAVLAAIAIAVTLIVRRTRSRQPGQPSWQPGPPSWQPSWQPGPPSWQPSWQPGPPSWQPGQPSWQPGAPSGPPGPPSWQPGPPGNQDERPGGSP
jgi:hypothetical protein